MTDEALQSVLHVDAVKNGLFFIEMAHVNKFTHIVCLDLWPFVVALKYSSFRLVSVKLISV